MPSDDFLRSIAALHRKLRALGAVANDAAATAPEKEAARALQQRIEDRLQTARPQAGDWSDAAFRLGRWARDRRNAVAGGAAETDWTGQAHRLGKAVRRGYKKWLSE